MRNMTSIVLAALGSTLVATASASDIQAYEVPARTPPRVIVQNTCTIIRSGDFGDLRIIVALPMKETWTAPGTKPSVTDHGLVVFAVNCLTGPNDAPDPNGKCSSASLKIANLVAGEPLNSSLDVSPMSAAENSTEFKFTTKRGSVFVLTSTVLHQTARGEPAVIKKNLSMDLNSGAVTYNSHQLVGDITREIKSQAICKTEQLKTR